MGRPIVLSNSRLAVGLNEKGFVHDFYFPYIGLENLTTSRSVHHKIGVWVDGHFSWLESHGWHSEIKAPNDVLCSDITMTNDSLGLRIHFTDWVDIEKNVFCRDVNVENLLDKPRDFRMFFHQVFQISNEGRSDTALYVPSEHLILDYKGRVCISAFARVTGGKRFDQYATGSYNIEGKSGTYHDAEDGELSGNAVEHGGVDSVLRVSHTLEPKDSIGIEYWLTAGDSQFQIEVDHEFILREGLTSRLEALRGWWAEWLAPAESHLKKMDASDFDKDLIRRSLLIIKAHCDHRGGILASCDSSIYNYNRDYYSYVWPRDGAFVLWPLIRLGLFKEARKFFRFCRDIQKEDGYLMHKYLPDRSIGSTWHPLVNRGRHELAIQEDETAIIVFMLGEFLDYSHDDQFVEEMYREFVIPACDFMSRFIDLATNLPHASYDLWEEKFATHSYTTALTYRALMTGCRLGERYDENDGYEQWRQAADRLQEASGLFFEPDGQYLRKSFLLGHEGDLSFDNTLDVSSLYGHMTFEYGSDKSQIAHTAKAIEERLMNSSPSGGVPRYEFDNYFAQNPKHKGNPWFVTTLWLAQYYIRVDRKEDAKRLLDWTYSKLSGANSLPEQIGADNSARVGVEPLIWSHAELINTLLDYYS